MTSAFDITRLTPQERLDLIGELWDSLSAKDVRLSPELDAEHGRAVAQLRRRRSISRFVGRNRR